MKLLLAVVVLALTLNEGPNIDATLPPLLLASLLSQQRQALLHPGIPFLHPIPPLLQQVHSLLHPASPLLQQVQPLLHPVSPLLQQVQPLLYQEQTHLLNCQTDQSVQFRKALYEFSLNLYNALSDHENDHFVTSPFSIWMSLAALAEGAESEAQVQLFKVLGLPQQNCLRQKFYTIAMSLEIPGTDVSFIRNRGIIFDEGVHVKKQWRNFVKTSKLLEYVSAPIKDKPRLAEIMLQKAIGSKMLMPLQGNSVLIDSLTYRGVWTNSFDAEHVAMEPFYNDSGEQIGIVPMMRIRLRTRIAEIPLFKAKIVELPVGNDGRYTMLIGMGMEHNGAMRKLANLQHGAIISEVIKLLHLSPGPIEIAIPKITMSTDYNARVVLEQLGIRDIWTDPAATKHVSRPAALPGGLVQHVIISLTPEGITPPPPDNAVVGLLGNIVNEVGDDNFIANKPFMYVLIESRTHNVLFAGSYSDPNRA
ncbi:hypothetical protein K1T71_012689 [Dendrolimus kikuchii]|uniref:Uncharacterized protein n=1 Tax=Dendrolimus kikuchii TaxID=765133 RepID=A0ACC1CK24_9NEOP|nr:hypothetical protein K1T71_012689 [Dendrolimus kikuchii]